MNCLLFYACGAFIFALSLIEVISAGGPTASSSYRVNSADLGGRHYGPGYIVFPAGKVSERCRFAYAENVGEGEEARSYIRAMYHMEKVTYFKNSRENNFIEFRYDDGTTNILTFDDDGQRAALKQTLLEEKIFQKTGDAKPSN